MNGYIIYTHWEALSGAKVKVKAKKKVKQGSREMRLADGI